MVRILLKQSLQTRSRTRHPPHAHVINLFVLQPSISNWSKRFEKGLYMAVATCIPQISSMSAFHRSCWPDSNSVLSFLRPGLSEHASSFVLSSASLMTDKFWCRLQHMSFWRDYVQFQIQRKRENDIQRQQFYRIQSLSIETWCSRCQALVNQRSFISSISELFDLIICSTARTSLMHFDLQWL